VQAAIIHEPPLYTVLKSVNGTANSSPPAQGCITGAAVAITGAS
jgi:hypothetical protein